MKRVAVSACLLGQNTRYDGKNNKNDAVLRFLQEQADDVVVVCPETMGGLPIPRPPAEQQPDGRVVDKTGKDVSAAFEEGSNLALAMILNHHCCAAILKARSPSCGVGTIYDGTFTGRTIPGDGTLTKKLRAAGVPVYTEENLPEHLEDVEE